MTYVISNYWDFKRMSKICLIDFTILSQAPPMWVAAGGLQFHLISVCLKYSSTLLWFSQDSSFLRILFAPLKLVPLSENTSFGCSLRVINRRKAFYSLNYKALLIIFTDASANIWVCCSSAVPIDKPALNLKYSKINVML